MALAPGSSEDEEEPMDFPIDTREASALLKALDSYLPELEYELARVKLERDRHELVVEDELLRALRGRLERTFGAAPTPPPAPPPSPDPLARR
jgi:hypothetical protein